MNPALDQLRNTLTSLSLKVEQAEQELQEGRVIGMDSLESDVERFCRAIKSLSPHSAREIQPDIAELITALDTLAERLNEFKHRHTNR